MCERGPLVFVIIVLGFSLACVQKEWTREHLAVAKTGIRALHMKLPSGRLAIDTVSTYQDRRNFREPTADDRHKAFAGIVARELELPATSPEAAMSCAEGQCVMKFEGIVALSFPTLLNGTAELHVSVVYLAPETPTPVVSHGWLVRLKRQKADRWIVEEISLDFTT